MVAVSLKKKEKRELLLRFSKCNSMSLVKDAFSLLAGKGTDYLFFGPDCNLLQDRKKRGGCIKKKLIKRFTKEISVLKCPCGKSCLLIPIIQGNNVYGFALVLHLRREPGGKEMLFMKSYVAIALKEFQKEQELSRLYETIRPRAIALSTIHTIHRLLSSTLEMNELLERIARLTLQVMRCKYCSIMLLDDSRNFLIPNAIIDLKDRINKDHKKYRKIRVGVGPAGMAARSGKSRLSRNSIYVALVEEDIIGVICARDKTDSTPFSNFEMEILLTLAEQAVIAIKNAQLYEDQKKMAYGSIRSLATLLDMKSPHTYTHSEGFVKMVLAIAEEMNLPREKIRNLRYAALLPDTGGFSIPDEIFKKRGGLSKKEHAIIRKRHLESLKILEPLEFLKPAMPIVIHHHERYDGTGYPDGLRGTRIPIGARIIAVVDAFEAMVHSRPYKGSKISIPQALKEIESNKLRQFDPEVVDAFASVLKKPGFKQVLYNI